MLALALKWFARALFALSVFSALTAIYMYYTLNYGSCINGGEACNSNLATLYAAGIGIVGFGVSAYASNRIAKSFQNPDRP